MDIVRVGRDGKVDSISGHPAHAQSVSQKESYFTQVTTVDSKNRPNAHAAFTLK